MAIRVLKHAISVHIRPGGSQLPLIHSKRKPAFSGYASVHNFTSRYSKHKIHGRIRFMVFATGDVEVYDIDLRTPTNKDRPRPAKAATEQLGRAFVREMRRRYSLSKTPVAKASSKSPATWGAADTEKYRKVLSDSSVDVGSELAVFLEVATQGALPATWLRLEELGMTQQEILALKRSGLVHDQRFPHSSVPDSTTKEESDGLKTKSDIVAVLSGTDKLKGLVKDLGTLLPPLGENTYKSES